MSAPPFFTLLLQRLQKCIPVWEIGARQVWCRAQRRQLNTPGHPVAWVRGRKVPWARWGAGRGFFDLEPMDNLTCIRARRHDPVGEGAASAAAGVDAGLPPGRQSHSTSRVALRSLGALLVLMTAPATRAGPVSLNVEGFAGWQHLELHDSAQQIASSVNSEGTVIAGGGVLLDLAGLGVGIAVDKTVSGSAQPWAGSIVAGFLPDLLALRLELLAEVGRRATSFGDLLSSSGATFVGLRPGVSFRLPPLPVRLGVAGLVRWPTSRGDIGSPDFGIVGKIGFELL